MEVVKLVNKTQYGMELNVLAVLDFIRSMELVNNAVQMHNICEVNVSAILVTLAMALHVQHVTQLVEHARILQQTDV